MNTTSLIKWFSRWVYLSLAFDFMLLMMFGWAEFRSTYWWKSIFMALLVMPFWVAATHATSRTEAKT